MRCDRLTITDNVGTEYSLSELGAKRVFTSQSGFGMPNINRLTETGPFQHGATNLGFRLQPRVVQISFVMVSDHSTERFFSGRDKLFNTIFVPTNTPLKLKYYYSDGSDVVRQLDCYYNGGLSGDFDKFENSPSIPMVVELLAIDPAWYDPELKTKTYITTDVVGDSLVFPFSFGDDEDNIVFAETSIASSTVLTYNGSWIEYPTITITGPITNPTVWNISTSEKISIEYELGSGEYVIIDLTYGNKSVVNGAGTNLIGTVTSDSDLATFHLAPSPEVTDGENTIEVSGAGIVAGESSIDIEYYERYLGV